MWVAATRVILVAFGLVACAACRTSLCSGAFEQTGQIRHRTHSRARSPGAETPSGCEIVSGAHRLVEEMGSSADDPGWIPIRFSFCQLPAAWRDVVIKTQVGDEVEYVIPPELVPGNIAALLGVDPARPLRIIFRMDTVGPAPKGLSFPLKSEFPKDAHELPGGLRYVVVPGASGSPELTPRGAAVILYSFWLQDGTLVGTNYFSPTPTVLSVAKTDGYARRLLGVVRGEGDQVMAWLPADIAKSEQPLILQATIQKVLR